MQDSKSGNLLVTMTTTKRILLESFLFGKCLWFHLTLVKKGERDVFRILKEMKKKKKKSKALLR